MKFAYIYIYISLSLFLCVYINCKLLIVVSLQLKPPVMHQFACQVYIRDHHLWVKRPLPGGWETTKSDGRENRLTSCACLN